MTRAVHKKYLRVMVISMAVPITVMMSACNPLLNFGIVKENVLYRSGEPDLEDFQVIHQYLKLKTILNLQREVSPVEENFAREHQIQIVHVPMSAAVPPTEDQVTQFFDIVTDVKRHPILMHCQGGADRTGVLTALYRIEFENWSKKDAVFEMMKHGHIPLLYPAQTQYIYQYKRRN